MFSIGRIKDCARGRARFRLSPPTKCFPRLERSPPEWGFWWAHFETAEVFCKWGTQSLPSHEARDTMMIEARSKAAVSLIPCLAIAVFLAFSGRCQQEL